VQELSRQRDIKFIAYSCQVIIVIIFKLNYILLSIKIWAITIYEQRFFMKNLLLTIIGLFYFMTSTANAQDLSNTLYMELKDGRVIIEMRPDLAPQHVARIKELVSEKFYDGLKFHRVIDGFMVQTGDPLGNGTGGSGVKLQAEFNNEPHVKGTVSMARAQDVNSGDSQFFICLADARFLDGQYTVWGKVTQGMDIVDKIKKGNPNDNGTVTNPDIIISLRLASDIKN
jgi:peptidylprolyl isomerase